jgi:hypothetical protein
LAQMGQNSIVEGKAKSQPDRELKRRVLCHESVA